MSRPGFLLHTDEETPPLITLAGSDVNLQRFPVGTRVVYPPEAVASSDPTTLIDQALASPAGTPPLADHLKPGMKLTVVVGNIDPVRPGMRFDVRRNIVERVLEQAARGRVDDVAILIAGGLGPRWRGQDIVTALGDRIATSFLPDGMIDSHDVSNEHLTTVTTVEGQPVKLPERLAASDLVVTIDVCHGRRPQCLLALGATDLATINRIAGVDGSQTACDQVSEGILEQVPVFAVTAVLGQPHLQRSLNFLNRREWEWRLPQQAAYALARQWVAAMPRQGAQRLHGMPRADYELCDVIGGDARQVLRQAQEVWQAANAVPLPPASTLVTSVWGSALEAGDPVGSPIDAAHYALGHATGLTAGYPLTAPGAAVIAFHPLTRVFSNRIQAAASDFFTKVLPESRDPHTIQARFEASACADTWYLKLYREHHAYHPLAVFHTWYATQRAASQLGMVIWVGADRTSARILGHRAATRLEDALELCAAHLGAGSPLTYIHPPGTVAGAEP
ncbi:MAG: lactate racemase domain-containing protein [Propionibacteriaceae bacterium]|nr:lactate racemase domain-containing protein [Propionibacteriaceae bacterium]